MTCKYCPRQTKGKRTTCDNKKCKAARAAARYIQTGRSKRMKGKKK